MSRIRPEYLAAHPYDRLTVGDARFRQEPEEEEEDEGDGKEDGDDEEDDDGYSE